MMPISTLRPQIPFDQVTARLITLCLTLILMGSADASAEAPSVISTGAAVLSGRVEPASGTLRLEAYDAASLAYVDDRPVPIDAAGRFKISLEALEPSLWRLVGEKAKAFLVIDGAERIEVLLRPKSLGGVQIKGSSGNGRLEAFGDLLEERNHFYFDDLKRRGEAALAAGDAAAFEAMEEERDHKLTLFYTDLGEALEAMGHSAAVLGGLRYLDIYKQRPLFVAARDRFARYSPDGQVSRALRRMLADAETADVGAPAPAFVLQDRHGQTFRLEDFRGQWLYLDFWASWCLSCRLEMPRLAKIHREFAAAGFAWVGITPYDERDAWEQTLDQSQAPGTHLWDGDHRVAKSYRVGRQLPASFLVDPSGKIMARDLSAKELQERLAAELPKAAREPAYGRESSPAAMAAPPAATNPLPSMAPGMSSASDTFRAPSASRLKR